MVNATERNRAGKENMEYWGRKGVQFYIGRSEKTSPRVMFEQRPREERTRTGAFSEETASQAEEQGMLRHTLRQRETLRIWTPLIQDSLLVL